MGRGWNRGEQDSGIATRGPALQTLTHGRNSGLSRQASKARPPLDAQLVNAAGL
eukprot:CAMPEP_0178408898 /NCGR_PEP_ID=MMETSP0689_2-20121128/20180_1 /TAXON_ID=160604 /ORGANISM="Amphidinium massartii, Strain CS-259" /LENGTH=53 /DNA_ID=CAMNT_0020030015 /DNA_START=1045 /DNA_END=1206 /DNA_ORIENTATION=-